MESWDFSRFLLYSIPVSIKYPAQEIITNRHKYCTKVINK
jgi:hypothetical protein